MCENYRYDIKTVKISTLSYVGSIQSLRSNQAN